MIIINGKKYEDYNIDIKYRYCKYNKTNNSSYGVSNTDKIDDNMFKAPFIEFKINDEICIGIETRYNIKDIDDISNNTKLDFYNYITDIIYEDNNGWISIITGNYSCYITRINSNDFMLDFHVDYNDYDIESIDINSKITLF